MVSKQIMDQETSFRGPHLLDRDSEMKALEGNRTSEIIYSEDGDDVRASEISPVALGVHVAASSTATVKKSPF